MRRFRFSHMTAVQARILATCALLGAVLLTGCTQAVMGAQPQGHTPAAATTSVPAEFQSLYSTVESNLNAADAYLSTQDHGSRHRFTFAAELLPANSNIGSALLKPETLTDTDAFLNGLKKLHVRGVTIAVSYPVFTPSYPDYPRILSFYRTVVSHVRKLGMKLDIEAHLIFANTGFSSVSFNYSSLSYSQFESGWRQMIQTIIDQLHPDYLSFLSEPDTQARITGFQQLKDPNQATQLVQYVLKGLKRGKTLVGAGNGSWISPQFAENFAAHTSIDYVEIHVYFTDKTTIQNAITMAHFAQSHHKRIVIDEAWLFKSQALGSTSQQAASRLNNFSFWRPLDQKFLALMAKLGRIVGADFLSAYWSNHFFAYTDYSPTTANMRFRQLAQAEDQVTYKNLQTGKHDSIGDYFQKLVNGND